MSLEIINNKGVFEVCGEFTLENKGKVKEYFNNLLDSYYEVVMCLNKIKKIDESAVDVLKFIHNKAAKRSKILFVLGKENRVIKKSFKAFNISYIFKNDYN
jgi:anti-anti-sigma regulatory factor